MVENRRSFDPPRSPIISYLLASFLYFIGWPPCTGSSGRLICLPVKPRTICLQSLQIFERITGDIGISCLNAGGRRLYAFSAWRCGWARFCSRSPNEPAKRLARNIEALFRESLPDLFECLSRAQSNLNLRQQRTQKGGLGGGRFLSEFLQSLAVEVWA